VITWHAVVDDFGEYISVTEIHWPNRRYFTRIIESLYPLSKKGKKS
jgi:hypothetical protein